MRPRIDIDPDLEARSKEYVEDQIRIITRYGEAPVLSPEAMDMLIYLCAKYPQKLRNLVSECYAD